MVSTKPVGLRAASGSELLLFFQVLIPLCCVGCGNDGCYFVHCQDVPESLDVANAKPELDLLQLDFNVGDGSVNRHHSKAMVIAFPDGELTLVPTNGSKVQRTHQMMCRMATEMSRYRVDQIKSISGSITVYRYLEDVNSNNFARVGHYLINIDDYWLNGMMSNRNNRQVFDQQTGDRFFMSLRINCER